jgi:carbon starvation protein
VAVLVYCMAAAILPVSVLMQPRDFLSATFLYAILALGLLGAIVGPRPFDMPAFLPFQSENLGMLVPFLFITVACGACSGFHSMVASGTTSKQLRRETDVRKVAYGGMLVEGILATLAIGCIAVSGGMQSSPIDTFAGGAAIFFSSLGIPIQLGTEFATLAVSTFLLTTLDTCTRLGRFLIEELFGWSGAASRYLSTLFIGLVAGYLSFHKFTDLAGNSVPAWQALWPLFGATNQLLAALALTTFTVFLKSRGISYLFAAIPAAIMIAMPMSALAIMAGSSHLDSMLRIAAALQLVMAVFIIGMSLKFLVKTEKSELRVS